jgi:hypothetical protein
MTAPRFTLVTDGPSDGEMLVPILEWLLRMHCRSIGINVIHANTLRCREVPRRLEKRIAFALEAYPCDCLFVHRDAEGDSADARRLEIQKAIEGLDAKAHVPHVCVVPIRMTEAWLLFDSAAIRLAAGNPNGRVQLDLPPLSDLEYELDPKRLLHELLTVASEFTGRRKRSFNPKTKVRLVARRLNDFSPLRKLSAFCTLESDINRIIKANEWMQPGEAIFPERLPNGSS